MYPKALQYFYDFLDLIFSLVRMLWITRFVKTPPFAKRSKRCLVMANGPSLHTSLQKLPGKLADYDLVAVNFMGISEEFVLYKPSVYILCDPAFWFNAGTSATQDKVRELYRHLIVHTSWDLQLYFPWQAERVVEIQNLQNENRHIRLQFYNKTKFEGLAFLKHPVYSRQWGMPRAQNVMAAALMLAVYSDYEQIYLAGADNDWVKNLWVDEENRLRISNRHFYTEEGTREDRIIPIKIHEQFAALYHTFKTYVDINLFAKRRGIKIINLTPLSYIDAFKKTEA
jgi:hypothetical protein